MKDIEVEGRRKELDFSQGSKEGGIIRGKIFCIIRPNALQCE